MFGQSKKGDYPEDGGSKLTCNAGIYMPVYDVWYLRRL